MAKKKAAKTQPTNEQVEKEIATLKQLKPKIPHHSMFGDNNWAAIDAQIVVLEKRWLTNQIYREYEDPDDETGRSTHIIDSALDARYWLDGNEEAPSKGWEGLVK